MWVSESVEKAFLTKEQKVLEFLGWYARKCNPELLYCRIGIFGSYARKEYKATSDIDFCVIMKRPLSRVVRCELKDQVEEFGADLIFVTEDYYLLDNSVFAKSLRRDFMELRI